MLGLFIANSSDLPRCGRHVAVLYGLGLRFLCRHCYQLSYSSQQENASDRMMRKARKIRERLGASDSLFDSRLERGFREFYQPRRPGDAYWLHASGASTTKSYDAQRTVPACNLVDRDDVGGSA